MGASATRQRAESPARRRLAVAVSGGRDSTALLHCAAHLAQPLGVEVLALHVNHGLMPQANAWEAQLQRQCRRWARAGWPVQMQAHRLRDRPPAGASVEAWARRERYRALAEMARDAGCDMVLLAHHRRDQAETFLLQALRGGDPRGLAGMPIRRASEGITWIRPWLDHPRQAIDAYVARHRLSWVEDESNAQARFARSRLRTQVWPALEDAFADAEVALAAAGRRAQEAAECLQALADIDLAEAMPSNDALRPEALLHLPLARRRNALRLGLERLMGQGTPRSLVDRLSSEITAGSSGRWPAPGDTELRLYDGQLSWHRREIDSVEGCRGGSPVRFDLRQAGDYELGPGLGVLKVAPVDVGGIALDQLRQVDIRARAGSEQFQFSVSSTARSLKKQFQARRVPAWARSGPVLWVGDRLIFVAGLGIDGRSLAAAGHAQMALSWEPDELG